VRNSGAVSVVEGVGDHGAEYMTGGRIVVIGETGRNFAAGMSGGIAYIHDPTGSFPGKCNMGMVGLEKVIEFEEQETLKSYLLEHIELTGSTTAKELLEQWPQKIKEFVKVMPHDYKRVLLEQKSAASNN
jgi:glutamate synthase domain-containing protein 3